MTASPARCSCCRAFSFHDRFGTTSFGWAEGLLTQGDLPRRHGPPRASAIVAANGRPKPVRDVRPRALDGHPDSVARPSPRREHGGAGIGLSVVRVLADRLHIPVDVEIEPARGSTFTLTIPTRVLPG